MQVFQQFLFYSAREMFILKTYSFAKIQHMAVYTQHTNARGKLICFYLIWVTAHAQSLPARAKPGFSGDWLIK